MGILPARKDSMVSNQSQSNVSKRTRLDKGMCHVERPRSAEQDVLFLEIPSIPFPLLAEPLDAPGWGQEM